MDEDVGELLQRHVSRVRESVAGGEDVLDELSRLAGRCAQELGRLAPLQLHVHELAVAAARQATLLLELRERSANTEAGRADLAVKNKALQVEVDAARKENARLKAKLRELDVATGRPRAPSSQLVSPDKQEAASSSPLSGQRGSASVSGLTAVPPPFEEGEGSSRRLRAQTHESASSHSSFTNVAAFFAKAAPAAVLAPQATHPLPAGSAASGSGSSRSRAGSAPQPLSPSRTPHGAQGGGGGGGGGRARSSVASVVLEGVHVTGRASPALSSHVDEDGGQPASSTSSRPALPPLRSNDILQLTLVQWQDKQRGGQDRRAAKQVTSALALSLEAPPLPLRPQPLPRADAPGKAQPAQDKQPQGTAIVCTVDTSEREGSATAVNGVHSALRGADAQDVVQGSAVASALTSDKPAASPPSTASPPTPVWSSVASMWSSWVAGSVQARAAADEAAHGSPSPSPIPPSGPATRASTLDGALGGSSDTPLSPRGPELSAFKSRTRSLPGVLLRAAMAPVLEGQEDGGGQGSKDVTEASAPRVQTLALDTAGRPVTLANFLEAIPLFASLTGTERSILSASLEPLRGNAGEAVCTGQSSGMAPVGEPALFLVVQGQVSISGGRTREAEAAAARAFPSGTYFGTVDVPPGFIAVARTRCVLLMVRMRTLQALLDWFAEARGIGRGGAAPSLPGAGEGAGGPAPTKARAHAERVEAALAAVTDLPTYLAALRRVSPLVHAIRVPPRPSTLVGSTRPGGGRVPSVRREVEQAYKDLAREEGILVNGEYLPLGTAERFQHFVAHLAGVVRAEVLPGLGAVGGGGGQVEGENAVASVVCDLLVAACRTVTGGDSFLQVNALLARPDVAFIAAESGGQSPTEITVGPGPGAHITAVSTFKVCAMSSDEEEASAAPPAGARERSGTNSSLSGSAGVWALLRCRIEERVAYGGGPPPPKTASAPPPVGSTTAVVAMSFAYQAAVSSIFAVGKAKAPAMDAVPAPPPAPSPLDAAAPLPVGSGANVRSDSSVAPTRPRTAPHVRDMETAITAASGDCVHLASSERALDVSVHVFDRPE